MRRVCVLAALSITLVLAGCGDENTSTEVDNSSQDEGTPSDDATADVDPEAALLGAEDLPDGADVQPVDMAGLNGGMEDLQEGIAEDVTYDPAECQDSEGVGFYGDDVESAGMHASVGEGLETDTVQHSVFRGVDESDLSELEGYYQDCGEITISGTVQGQSIDQVLTTSTVDAPSVDADQVTALETTLSVAGTTEDPERMIFIVDGDYGIQLSGAAQSETFNVDELANVALERLNEARN